MMRKFATLIVAAAMTVGTFGLAGCEQEDTMTPVDTTGGTGTGTGTMESTDTMEGDTMAGDVAPTTLPAPTTAPTAP